MKPTIGIIPLFDLNRNAICMINGYLKAIEVAGGIPVVLPVVSDFSELEKLDKMIDGYLFTGGNNLDNIEITNDNLSVLNLSDIKPKMEEFIYNLAKAENKPILGINEGMELFNLYEGGINYDNLINEHPTSENHYNLYKENELAHQIIILYETKLYNITKRDRIYVNSTHNKAIKKLAKNFRILAVSLDDLVEACYDKTRLFSWGLQWDPELILDDISIEIFKEFVNSSLKWNNEYKK